MTRREPMQTIEVHVEPDFIESLAKTKPITAMAELIWNALDADAKNVTVEFEYNSIDGLETIRISDDGFGITLDEAEKGFGSLGGSWKRATNRTKSGRYLHGKEGKGRFRAFALGKKVSWKSVSRDNGSLKRFEISAALLAPSKFHVEGPLVCRDTSTWTVVELFEPKDRLGTLTSEKANEYIAEHFALYLHQYPDVQIHYNGSRIDPKSVEEHSSDYNFTQMIDGREEAAAFKLTVIEWKTNMSRALMLCDEGGFTLCETKPGIQARGFNFTAYLSSAYLKELHGEGILDVEEISSELQKILDITKSKLRGHFRRRESEEASFVIDEWKKEQVYPYSGVPADVMETVERQVFDVVALNIHNYLPEFEDSELANKKLALRLLRHAIETRPSTIVRILADVVKLPKEKQDEFVELLEKTSLESIINASKVVTDRLDFLSGFNTFLFDNASRNAALERQQLQQLLVGEPWIFGEKYNLAQQEATLTDVLRRHYEILGKNEEITEPVKRLDGSDGRVDLMFGAVTQFDPGKREHLIVELKRPSQKIDSKAMEQVESYVEAIADDERFNRTDTKWEFYAVSNTIHPRIETRSKQPDRPKGLYLDHPDKPIRIWVKTWGEIIQECEARLHFVKQHLDYDASHQAGLEYLRKRHSEYLPKVLTE